MAKLNDLFENIKKNSYDKQPELLNSFQNIFDIFLKKYENSSTLDAQQKFKLKIMSDEITQRIKQIDEFSKNPKLTDQTALEKELRLAVKIPADQVQAIMDRIELFGYANARELTTKDITTLKDMLNAMDHFKLQEKYPIEYGFIDDLIKNAERPIVSLPTGLTKNDVAPTSIIGEIGEKITTEIKDEKTWAQTIKDFFIKDGTVVVKNIAAIVIYPAQKIAEGFSYIIRETGKFLQRTFTAPEFVNKMADAPEIFEGTLKTIGGFDKAGGGLVKEVLRFDIGIQRVLLTAVGHQDIAKALADFAAVPYSEHVSAPVVKEIEKYVKAIGVVGKTLKAIIEFPKYIGEKLENSVRTKNEVTVLRYIDDVQNLIEQERAKIRLAKQKKGEEFPGVVELGNFLFKIGNYFSELVYSTNNQIDTAQKNYEKARKDYFGTLGIDYTEKITSEQVATIIQKKELIKNDPIVVQKTDALLQAINDLAFAYRVFINKFDAIEMNLQFLVDAWDTIIITPDGQNADIPVIIKGIFDLRDMKLAYLSELKSGILQMESDAAKFKDSPVAGLADDAIRSYKQIVDNKIFETIYEFATSVDEIDNIFTKQKEFLESRMPKVVDDTSSSGGNKGPVTPPPWDVGGQS